ncbi:MAG: DUF4340 domain-containing protein [Calditrichaeota bacterium]|nr:DUF4340 domain-containing protein [Calditrichota bacterium]
MKNRLIYILGGVLIAQIIIFGLLSIDTHRVKEKVRFLSQDTSQVNYVKIRNKDGMVVLNRVGQNWRMTEPYNSPANPSYVKTLLEKLAGLELESYITSNEDKYSQYEMTDTTAAYVEVGKEGGTIDKFWCGKPSDTYTHTYMRRDGSKEIWLVSGTPRSSLTRRPKDWRDKTVLTLDRTLVQRILLRHPAETYELVREIGIEKDTLSGRPDTTWRVNPPKGASYKPETNVMNRILNTICKLNSTDIKDAGQDEIPAFDPVVFGVDVFLEGNQRHSIDFIQDPSDDSRWLARLDGNAQQAFVIYQSSVKNLMKKDDELKGGEKYENPQEKKRK